jgi:hypothetical protein
VLSLMNSKHGIDALWMVSRSYVICMAGCFVCTPMQICCCNASDRGSRDQLTQTSPFAHLFTTWVTDHQLQNTRHVQYSTVSNRVKKGGHSDHRLQQKSKVTPSSSTAQPNSSAVGLRASRNSIYRYWCLIQYLSAMDRGIPSLRCYCR